MAVVEQHCLYDMYFVAPIATLPQMIDTEEMNTTLTFTRCTGTCPVSVYSSTSRVDCVTLSHSRPIRQNVGSHSYAANKLTKKIVTKANLDWHPITRCSHNKTPEIWGLHQWTLHVVMIVSHHPTQITFPVGSGTHVRTNLKRLPDLTSYHTDLAFKF